MILLVADIEELKADKNAPGRGLIIESHMQQGRGAIAVAIVQQGTIAKNDYLFTGCSYAKIRVLEDSIARPITQAGPSTPVIITGFKTLPEFGDEFIVVKNEKVARDLVYQHS